MLGFIAVICIAIYEVMPISEEIKELFFPLFEDITMNERLNRFSLRFPQEKLLLFDRLCDIINKDYSKINRWVKACAIDLLDKIRESSTEELEKILAANIINPDPMLSELAGWKLFNGEKATGIGTIAVSHI